MMKITKLTNIIYLALAFAFFGTTAFAFHDGGVASCQGCHVMHNSEDGVPIDPDSPSGYLELLLFESATDLCLSCHASFNGMVMGSDPIAPPDERGGGNFVFLLEDNINDADGGELNPIDGNFAGHNVFSAAYGIPVDPINNNAPGGNYPSDQLSCISCHDPHGNTNFRMLRGIGQIGKGSFSFASGAPIAQGININSQTESENSHTAYQRDWADWCANCHGMYHTGENQIFEHPVNQVLETEERDSYNHYNNPLDPYGGTHAGAYLPEVPLEDLSITPTTTYGASNLSRVSCITCHRAHATSAPNSLRWDPNIEFLELDGVISGSYPLNNPIPFPGQRALCIKCHYTAAAEHGVGQPCMGCH